MNGKEKARSYFKTRFSRNEKRDSIWKSICAYLQRYVPENSVVLDVGAGYCSFINNIKAKEKHALDLFPNLKDNANSNVKCHITSSTNMGSLKSSHFDVVFASNFFEHLNEGDTKKTLDEIKRILKKNGKLMIIQPNYKYSSRDYFDDYTHKFPYSHVSMQDMLASNNFKILKCIPRFLPFSMKSRLSFFHFLIPIYIRLPYRPLAKQMFILAQKNE